MVLNAALRASTYMVICLYLAMSTLSLAPFTQDGPKLKRHVTPHGSSSGASVQHLDLTERETGKDAHSPSVPHRINMPCRDGKAHSHTSHFTGFSFSLTLAGWARLLDRIIVSRMCVCDRQS